MNTTRWYLTALLALALPAAAQYSQPVRDVENPAHSPLRISGTAKVDAGFVGAFGLSVGPALDATRRFVIEYVSFECGTSDTAAPVRVWLATAEKKAPGWYSYHNYPIRLGKTDADWMGHVTAIGAQPVRWYHDGGQALQAGISLNGTSPAGGISCNVEVSGYTVSMP